MTVEFQIKDFDDDFNPFTALLTVGGEGHITDPFPRLAELRRRGAVQEMDLHSQLGAPTHGTIKANRIFTVLGYKAASQVLLEAGSFSNKNYADNLGVTFGQTVTAMDPPDHPRYRRLFQKAFTPKMLENLRQRFQQVIDRLMATFIARGEADLVKEFALHFPFQFIMDLMCVPQQQRATFHKLAIAQMCVTFDYAHAVDASRKLGEYLTWLIDNRREHGDEDDFVAVLARAEIDGDRLPADILVSFFRQLMNAGGDTSYHGFSNILTALFTHPEQLEAIRRDRSLVKPAIEEGLRWDGPLAAIQRQATNDVVLDGVTIPAGAFVHVALSAANRDETIWAAPDSFDIYRPVTRHLAFGYGSHICIGQHLARMELVMALNNILDRLPNVRLNNNQPAPQIRGFTLRGAESVLVRFDT